MTTLLRIALDTRSVSACPVPTHELHIGGRALTSTLIAREVPADCHPLGPNNKLVMACGPLAGTLVSSANRLSIGAKSPLTGGIKESNAGGVTAYMMGRLGLRAIVFEGQPAADSGWMLLHVSAEGAELHPADFLAGLGTFAKADILRQNYGDHVGLTLIGPAGEQRMLTAGITNTDPEGVPSRYNGRGGLGAVLGSKKILAVVFDITKAPPMKSADKAAFTALNRELAQKINTTPATAEVFRKYGTAAMMLTTQALGALPTRNFSLGRFKDAEKINGQALHDTITARGGEGAVSHACMKGCLIKCSNVFPDKQGKMLCSPLEYENLGLLGSNLDIGDLDAIAALNWACNDIGCDTIETGAALGVAMEAGMLPFGDAKAALALLDEMRTGSPAGRLIGGGAVLVGKAYGCVRVPAVKNQSMPAYDPRGIKGLGVTYATSPQGADHTAGNTVRLPLKQHLNEGQVEGSRNAQRHVAVIDSLGVCMMLGAAAGDLSGIVQMVEAHWGSKISLENFRALGRETLRVEQDFNIRAGLTSVDDQLPEFMRTETNPDSATAFDMSTAEMQEVFA